MLSQMAIEDMQDLEGEGIKLTPSEVIQLNELGLRVERAATAGDVLACPRIGWAGDVPIFQPSLQVEAWVSTYVDRWFSQDTESYAACVLYACAHSQVVGFFQSPEMQSKASVLRRVEEWHKSLPVTAEQLKTALEFALYGNDAGSDIVPAPSEREPEPTKRRITADEYRQMLVDALIAAQIGLSKQELEALTETRLMGIFDRYNRNQGFVGRSEHLRACAEYGRTVAAIKRRHLEGVDNGR